MPFDGRQFQQSPFSLDSLIAWLETMPADAAYEYTDPKKCLLGRYTVESGGNCASQSAEYVIGANRLSMQHFDWNAALQATICKLPHTFGGALSRAKAYRDQLAKESVHRAREIIAEGRG